MELIIFAFIAAVGALPLAALVVAAAAFGRTRGLRTQLAAANAEIQDLRTGLWSVARRLHGLEPPHAPQPPPAYVGPGLAHEPERAAEPEPERAAEPEPEREPEAESKPEPDLAPAPDLAPEPDLAPAPNRPPRPRDANWERWLGVRGAAAAGAAILVIAGMYFFRYSVEHGFVTTTMRVILGTIAGVGCMVISERWLRTRHELLASCLTGAGTALLHLTFWAAFARYELVSAPVAGVLMTIVTVACCVLATKRRSVAIAAYGLLGGFATPLLLSTGSDRPFALFGYLLMLDVALLLVARRRGWGWLALCSLGATAVYQVAWISGRMGSDRVGFGAALCLVFGALFAILASDAWPARLLPPDDPGPAHDDGRSWLATRAAAVLMPFGLALYVGVRGVDAPLSFLAGYAAVLVLGAAVVGRRAAMPWLVLAASCAAFGVLAAWLMAHPVAGADTWILAATLVIFAALHHVALELGDGAGSADARLAAGLWVLGGLGLSALTAALGGVEAVTPWLVSWALLALLGLRQGTLAERAGLLHAVAATLGSALVALVAAHAVDLGTKLPSPGWMLAIVSGAAVAFSLATHVVREHRRDAGSASALLALVLLLALPQLAVGPVPFALGALLLLAVVALGVLRSDRAGWLVAGALTLACIATHRWLFDVAKAELVIGEATLLAAVPILAATPLLLAPAGRERLGSWRAPALVLPILSLPALGLHGERFGGGASLALVFAAVGVGMLFALRRRGPLGADRRRRARAWLGASTLGFVAVALPLALVGEWLTIGWSLFGLALMLLWRRVDHAGLKYVALGVFGLVSIRLVGFIGLAHLPPRGWPLLDSLTILFLVPVTAALLAQRQLGRSSSDGGERLRRWEPRLDERRSFVGPLLVSFAVVAGFAWLNLAVIRAFSDGPILELVVARDAARDLTLSVAWTLYALLLLAAGMWQRAPALRKLSLALLLMSCAKVFLHDLAHLEDLYRVMSLVGLALSLIGVSFVYKRFVFTDEELEGVPS